MIRSIAFIALSVGAYFAWKNRFEIQRQLARLGIETPLDRSNLTSTVKSGIAKAVGSAQYGVRSLDVNPAKVTRTA